MPLANFAPDDLALVAQCLARSSFKVPTQETHAEDPHALRHMDLRRREVSSSGLRHQRTSTSRVDHAEGHY